MHTAKLKKVNVFIFSVFLLVSFIFSAFSPALADTVSLPEAPENIENLFIYDEANVLSDAAETNISTRALNLYNNTSTQIFIMTVNTLNGENIETYADNILREWKIGGEKGRGLILLLDIEEDIYVTISGNELKTKFTSEVLQTILNEKLEPDFLVGQYEEGVNAFFTEVYYKTEDFVAELEAEGALAPENEPEKEAKGGPSFWSVFFTIILIIILLFAAFIAFVYIRGQIIRKKRREAARRRRQAERRAARSRRDYF